MRTCNGSGSSSNSSIYICLSGFAGVFLILLIAGKVAATVTTWDGHATGGVFNDDDNWNAASPGDNSPLPNGPNDHAIIGGTVDIDGTITFDADATHLRTTIQNTSGTLSIDTGTHTWTMTSYLQLNASLVDGFPKVRHIGGEIQAEFLLMGQDSTNPNLSLELTGATTHFHTTRGSGGYQIGVGPAVNGATMTVHNGAKMTADGQTIVGLQGSRNGKLTIDGVGTVFQGGNYLAAGHTPEQFGQNASNNTVEIINGAVASASNLYMAITVGAPDNNINVSGAGSKLTLTGVNNNDGAASNIGWRDGNNTLRIENGAVVDGTNRFILGAEATSANNQILINNGSLSGTNLEINRGNVSVTNGTVDLVQYFNESPMVMAYEGGGINAPTADGSFTFNSGMVRSVNANINNGSPFAVGNGGGTSATYHMRKDQAGNRGTHTFANGLALASNGILSGDGNIVGNVSGAAGAKVQVGASPGLVNVTGDWNNTGVGISLELDNLATSVVPGEQFDQLNVSGLFTHGGTVMIDRSELVGPTTTQQLKLIGWGSESGLSTSTAVSFLGGSPLTYNFQADGLYVTVQASAGTPGDYNNNGVVDAADYVVWRDNEGTNNMLSNNSLPGPIGLAHYNQWRANFGKSPGSGAELAESAIVPEPATWVLAIAVLAIAGVFRRRT